MHIHFNQKLMIFGQKFVRQKMNDYVCFGISRGPVRLDMTELGHYDDR